METPYWNPRRETMPRAELEELQLLRLRRLVEWAGRSPLHRKRLAAARVEASIIRSLDDLRRIPFLTREEWMEGQLADSPWGSLMALPRESAVRYHKTSGTTGSKPLWVLDTTKDWEWIAEMWCYALWGFGVRPRDIVFMAFGYGMFIGFWGAHTAAEKIGCLVVPGGNMTTEARLRELVDTQASVVCATPTYAFRLAQEADILGIDLAGGPVRKLILSGEPAGSIPSTKARLEQQWGARVADTAGMTEVGTVSMFECSHQPGGMHIIEDNFIEEVVDPDSGEPVAYEKPGERVVTSFGRGMIPLLRYRTSDMVVRAPATRCSCSRCFDLYEGGVRGRIDDMKLVRGTNVYPSSVEAIVREFSAADEFQIRLYTVDGIRDEIEVALEWGSEDNVEASLEKVRRALTAAHGGLRFEIRHAKPGSLPRFELKAKRLVDERTPLGGYTEGAHNGS